MANLNHYHKALATLLLLLSSIILASCSASDPQNTLAAKGDVAQIQQDLFWFIFWMAVVVFFVVEGVLVYAVFRFRQRPDGQLPVQSHGNTRLEVAWTIAPTLVLIVMAVPTIRDIVRTAQPPPGALEVRVIGHQWWWEYEYQTESGPVVTANEMHIPVDRPISMSLESADVIHSFWVPKLAGKQDAIPNHSNPLWFIAREPGLYYGQCAELCGLQHALMWIKVIAEPEEDFNRWLEAQRAVPPIPDPALATTNRQRESLEMAKRGSEVFTQKLCIACHTIQGTAAQGKIGPDLTHVGSRNTIVSGMVENNTENLRRWLQDPEAVKPGNIMAAQGAAYTDPNFRLSRDDIDALLVYLQGLK